jgi:hypothetical protein
MRRLEDKCRSFRGVQFRRNAPEDRSLFHVALDTNILHQEGLNSRAIKLLGRLSKANEVTIYVPDVVRREFTSRRAIDGAAELQSIVDAAKDLGKLVSSGDAIVPGIQTLAQTADQIRADWSRAVTDTFERWSSENRVTIVPVPPSALGEVLDAYFEGTAGFRKPKHREDFPDAFIAASLATIADREESLNVIVKDGTLRDHFSTLPRVSTFTTLTEFLNSSDVQKIVEMLDAQDLRVEAIKAALASPPFQAQISSYLRANAAIFGDTYLEEDQIHEARRLSVAGFGYSLDYVRFDPANALLLGRVSFIGADRYSIEIEIDAAARMFYCANYVDYMELPAEAQQSVEEKSFDEGIVELEESADVRLRGHVILQLKESLTVRELEIAARAFEANTDSVSIEVEIGAAEVRRPVWHASVPRT